MCESRYNFAYKMAKSAHKGQTRKIDGSDMFSHPEEVANILKGAGFDEDVQIAGLLHDTIEDTDMAESDVLECFGNRVLWIVLSNTENKELSWEDRKQHTIDHVTDLDVECRSLLIADKYSNLLDLSRAIEKHGDDVFKKFKRGREQQAWYFGSIADRMFIGLGKHEIPEFYNDYRELVDRVFGVEK